MNTLRLTRALFLILVAAGVAGCGSLLPSTPDDNPPEASPLGTLVLPVATDFPGPTVDREAARGLPEMAVAIENSTAGINVFETGTGMIETNLNPWSTLLPDASVVAKILGWSNDGSCSLLVYSQGKPSSESIVSVDLAGERVLPVADLHWGVTGTIIQSPDQQTLANLIPLGFRGREPFPYQIIVAPLADPTDSAILTRNGGGANLAWSPDSSAVAFTDLDIAGVMNLYLYDLESQMTLQLSDIATTADEIRSIAWSPDSDRVSFVVQNDVLFTLRIIEVDGARAQPEPIVGQSEITDHWWVDGETILYWAGSYFTSSGTGRSALYRIRLPSGEPQFVISRGSTPEKIFDNPHLIEGTNLVGFMGLTSFFTLDLDSGEIHQHFELDGPGSSWSALPLGASAPKSCDSTQVSP